MHEDSEDDEDENDTKGGSDFLFDNNWKKKRRVGARIFMDDTSSEEEVNYISSARSRNSKGKQESPKNSRNSSPRGKSPTTTAGGLTNRLQTRRETAEMEYPSPRSTIMTKRSSATEYMKKKLYLDIDDSNDEPMQPRKQKRRGRNRKKKSTKETTTDEHVPAMEIQNIDRKATAG